MLVTLAYALYAFGPVFIACELSQRLCNEFDEIYEIFGQNDWYKLSHKLKRMLPIILTILQQSTTIECFGSIPCCREVFQKVSVMQKKIFNKICTVNGDSVLIFSKTFNLQMINLAYSNFMVLRKFNI